MILPSQETVLFFTRFIHREKVPGGDGDAWVMELAERALDESFKVKLQAFINEVYCLTLYTYSGFLCGILGIILPFFLCVCTCYFFYLSCICRDLRVNLRTGRYLMLVSRK